MSKYIWLDLDKYNLQFGQIHLVSKETNIFAAENNLDLRTKETDVQEEIGKER